MTILQEEFNSPYEEHRFVSYLIQSKFLWTEPSVPDCHPMIFWLHLTSSFATARITAATSRHGQTTNVNMGRKKPLLQ